MVTDTTAFTISADTDLRLCKYFGLSFGYWLLASCAGKIRFPYYQGENQGTVGKNYPHNAKNNGLRIKIGA
jgi:hypothetical protein